MKLSIYLEARSKQYRFLYLQILTSTENCRKNEYKANIAFLSEIELFSAALNWKYKKFSYIFLIYLKDIYKQRYFN